MASARQAHAMKMRPPGEPVEVCDRAERTDGHLMQDVALCAAAGGRFEVVRFLVESGANKDQALKTDGATPLLIAAVFGQFQVVRFLVESGANKDQGRTDGTTPLDIAIRNHHHAVVQLLVESVLSGAP